jgi:hypothetical protein
MRYFVKVDLQGNPLTLFALNLDNPDSISEMEFHGKWEPTDRLVKALADGSMDYEEVSDDIAERIFPDAFVKEISKSIGKYELSKSEGEKRYTLGAMYIPDKLDAHGEWTDADELQRAVWDYVKSGDRRIRLQHNRDVVAGEWVEVMAFPYELTVPIQTLSGIEVNHTYPANTVFLGVIWESWAWELVQSGKILGYSIGGKAERLYVDMEEPVEKEDGPGINDVHIDTLMNPKKKKPKKV